MSFDILVYAIRHGNGPLFRGEEYDRTLDLLVKHHAADERMKEFVPTVKAWGEACG